jgi:hypothetical protein
MIEESQFAADEHARPGAYLSRIRVENLLADEEQLLPLHVGAKQVTVSESV